MNNTRNSIQWVFCALGIGEFEKHYVCCYSKRINGMYLLFTLWYNPQGVAILCEKVIGDRKVASVSNATNSVDNAIGFFRNMIIFTFGGFE